jgi:hypothetical protein
MWEEIFQVHHLVLVIIILILALIATGAGKGGGKMLLQLLKRVFGHEEININLPGGDMAGKQQRAECAACGLLVDPNKCPLHSEEHGRSMRNEKDIAEVKEDLKESRTKLWQKLDSMETTLTEIKVAVAQLCVESKYQQGKRGKN